MESIMIQEISREVVELFSVNGKTIFTAESCTAGLICASIASVDGASKVLLGGIVAYDNVIKTSILGVPRKILQQDGAVSFTCAQSMAENALKKSGSSYSVSVTGIAGPTGGTSEKPVGTVFVGIINQNKGYLYKFLFTGDRNVIREKTVLTVLKLLIAWEKNQDISDHLREIREIRSFILL